MPLGMPVRKFPETFNQRFTLNEGGVMGEEGHSDCERGSQLSSLHSLPCLLTEGTV